MTDDKFETPYILSKAISAENPYLFGQKSDLTRVKLLLEKAQKNLKALQVTLVELEQLDALDVINQGIRTRAKSVSVETAYEYVCDGCFRGGTTHVLSVLMDRTFREIDEYKETVQEIEAKWPKNKTKSLPAHIADEIAKEYVRYLGVKPTYGTENITLDDGSAYIRGSTKFSRAVSNIFEILKIEGNPYEAARSAANRYTDETAAAEKDAYRKSKMRWRGPVQLENGAFAIFFPLNTFFPKPDKYSKQKP